MFRTRREVIMPLFWCAYVVGQASRLLFVVAELARHCQQSQPRLATTVTILMTADSDSNGFTLVEVIIATIILGISLLGGVAFFSLNRNNLSYANRQRLATWGAVYKIEQLAS